MSDIIVFDLARSGQFAPEERRNMLSFPTERREVFFRDWRIQKTEYLVIRPRRPGIQRRRFGGL